MKTEAEPLTGRMPLFELSTMYPAQFGELALVYFRW